MGLSKFPFSVNVDLIVQYDKLKELLERKEEI